MSFAPKVLAVTLLGMTASYSQVLTSSAELRRITPSRMAEKLPVRIAGVVTSVRGEEFPEFTLQDGTGGVIGQLDGKVGSRIVAGQKVEIEGVTDFRAPSPRVRVDKLVVGPVVGMPEPLKVNPADLKDGSKDCSYVEFSGVIRSVGIEESVPPTRLVLDFGPSDRGLSVWVSHFDEEVKAKLRPDAEVIVRGVCNSWRSPNFQPFSTFVTVADPRQIDLVREAPVTIPERPLPELLALPVKDFLMHRERAVGVVTLVWPDGQVVLQAGGHAIRALSDEIPGLKLGERVEAVGFPSRMEGRLVLENTLFGRQGPAGLAEPEEIGPKQLIAESGRIDREGRLLRISGVFREGIRDGGKLLLVVESERRKFHAVLPVGEELPAGLKPSAHVALAGVCRMSYSDYSRRFGRAPDQFELQLQDARAITLIGKESWWTMERLLLVISPVLAGSLGWAMVLRRRVRRRSDLLVREIRARHDGELLAAERMRLAADLHDTLSQSLSGAAMQLEVVGALTGGGDEAESHLVLAKRLLDRGREDLRRTVWDLNPSALADQDLALALEKVARETARGCEISMKRSGEIASLPERIRVHLFRAGQEVLNNALRHGAPQRIGIAIDVSAGHAVLEIADDGCGFDPATAPGPDEGHFGLRSLKERIARLGGTLEISSSPQGTRVTANVPLNR